MKAIILYCFLNIIYLVTSTAFSQPQPCVFCEITSGKIQQSRVVFKDSTVAVFLSHAPDNPGHLLVVPLQHAQSYPDIPGSTVNNMMCIAKLSMEAIKRTDIKADGFQLLLNSGKAAGQHVMHAHLHVIPRYVGETLNTTQQRAPDTLLDLVAQKIRLGFMRQGTYNNAE